MFICFITSCLFYSSIYNNQAFYSFLHWNCSYQLNNHFTKSNPMANSNPLRYCTFRNILYSSSLLSSCINFTWLWNTFYSCLLFIPFAGLLYSIPINLVALELDFDVYSESLTHFFKFKMYLLNCLLLFVILICINIKNISIKQTKNKTKNLFIFFTKL